MKKHLLRASEVRQMESIVKAHLSMRIASIALPRTFRSPSSFTPPTLFPSNPSFTSNTLTSLTSLGLHLLRRPLRSHLTLYPTGLTPGRLLRALGLLSLLLTLLIALGRFSLRNGFLACSLANVRSLAAAILDQFERGADDTALLLDCATGAFLGDFLITVEKEGRVSEE